jgi:hypothetical protein
VLPEDEVTGLPLELLEEPLVLPLVLPEEDEVEGLPLELLDEPPLLPELLDEVEPPPDDVDELVTGVDEQATNRPTMPTDERTSADFFIVLCLQKSRLLGCVKRTFRRSQGIQSRG